MDKEMMEQLVALQGQASGKTGGVAKNISIIILALIFVIGVVGCFMPDIFSMTNFKMFLDVFIWPLMLLITSVGVGTVVGKVSDNGKTNNVVKTIEETIKKVGIVPEPDLK